MEKSYIESNHSMHMIQKTQLTHKHDYTEDFDTPFRPLPEVVAYDSHSVEIQYGRDPYLDEDLYNQ